MIKILIADDHAVFRRGLKEILEEDSDMTVAGEAVNGHEVLEKIRTADWDVVILDLSMPDRSGLGLWTGWPPSRRPTAHHFPPIWQLCNYSRI